MDQIHAGLEARTSYYSIGRKGRAAVALYALVTLIYLFVRIPLWNPAAPTLSTLLLAAELFGIFSLALHIFATWTLLDRRAPRPASRVKADLLITTWNEPVEMLRNTLLAAKQVRHAGKIWLLDDGARKEMKALARELGVDYLSRRDRSHAKAGNLNNALRRSKAEFVAIFDCDHAPSPDFLEKTLGYFEDDKVGFVQTPQDFYNVDSFQHRGRAKAGEVWHEQTLFYRVIQPGKDRWNAAFFCGSCAVVRRAALNDIGGFATGTITEDLHTSLKMHKQGWSSAYHAEALAFGLSPANLDQYETQRLRWARGAMQVWVKEGFLFRPGLTLAQRLSYLGSTATYFEGWQKAIIYFMPIVVILTGWMPIVWAGPGFLVLLTAWLLGGLIVNEVVSRGYAKTIWMEEYNFFRYFTFIKATFALIIPNDWRFVVTPKGRVMRLRFPAKLLPQAIVGVGAAAAVPIGLYLYLVHAHLSPAAFSVTMVFLALDIAIAGKALWFALGHLRQRRGSHRFPLPLLASLPGPDGERLVVAEDVSSDGMMLPAGSLDGEEEIEGMLHLPAGGLRFRGKVARRLGAGKVGVRFDWAAPSDADPLNACLYGNTLQWDVNAWSEIRRGWLLPRALRRFGNGTTTDWQLASLAAKDQPRIRCVARREDGIWRVVSYRRPQSKDALRLVARGDDIAGEDLQVGACETFSVGGGYVHISVLSASPSPVHAGFHRQPGWSAGAFA
jgi:cellulose synthase (UDP-forming)